MYRFCGGGASPLREYFTRTRILVKYLVRKPPVRYPYRMVTKGSGSTPPAIIRRGKSTRGSARETGFSSSDFDSVKENLWLRISAFLSMRSPNTQDTYRGIVTEWCEFLGAEAGSDDAARKISAASDLHAMAYRKWLDGRPGETPRAMRARAGAAPKTKAIHRERRAKSRKNDGYQSTLSNATINKKFTALRRIYRMLVSSGLARQNPFDVDKVPPPPAKSGQKRPTEMVDFSLVKKIVQSAVDTTAKGLRDRAILSILFGAGLRRSEVVALRLNDVCKTGAGTVFLRLRATKGKTDAEQALPKWAAVSVARLVQQRLKEGATAADYLFISYQGRGGLTPTTQAISDSGVYALFKEYCERAGAGRYVTPHSARATAITKLLSDGIPHRQVQEFSRHSSIQMVEVYDKRRMSVDENPGRDLDFED